MAINLFKISKAWFDLSFEDYRITPTHTTLIFYMIDLNNRLSWVDTFGLPALETGQALNISYNTFRKVLRELIEFGHVKMVKKSTNQHTANIVSLNPLYQNLLKQTKSKHKATLKQAQKQSDIIKPIKPIKPKNKYSDEIKNFTATLSKFFSKSIIDKLTETQKISWIDTIDKLIRIDGYKKDEITKAVKNATNDSFWAKNFYSLNKLRKKNDKQDCNHILIFLNLNNQTTQSAKQVYIPLPNPIK